VLDDADREAMARREEAEAVYERSRAKSATAAVDFETTLAARRDSSALEFAAEVTAAEQQLATIRVQSEQTRIESEQAQQEAASRSAQQLDQAMTHAHSLVAEAKTKAERIRGDSERELAAATQRRDSINAQLSNVRQMLAALGGVAVGNVAEMADAIAEKPKAAAERPKTATPAQQPKVATPLEAPKVATPAAKPQEDVTDKATDDKADDRKTGPTQPVGTKS
jgi:chromosome segregation ATPase